LQEFLEQTQHVILLDWRPDLGALGGDHEWDGIHAKTGHAKLVSEIHDFEDLGLDAWIGGVEVWLEVVEAMKVPSLGFLVTGPRGFLHTGKTIPLLALVGFLSAHTYHSRYVESFELRETMDARRTNG
jgi:hypothetical protein